MKRGRTLPKYCTWAFDRHGKGRVRFRKAGFSTYLPAPDNADDFQKAYAAALAGARDWRDDIGIARTKPGTMNALAVAYYRSPEWHRLKPITQKNYRRLIEGLRASYGDHPVRDLRREHLRAIIGKRHETPQAANRLLSIFRILLAHAVDLGWIEHNPAAGLKGYQKKTAGYHSWSEQEIAAYEARHPVGTKARLALALLLYTAQRRADVVAMGWQHVQGGRICIRQSKTGTPLSIPIHPALAEALDAAGKGNMTFLTTEQGAAFTVAGFGNWFRDRAREAGLKGCSPHGLRKAAARRLAEAGCSADVIRSITGHQSLSEVSVYTRAADQVTLSQRAIDALTGPKSEQTLSNLDSELDKISRKLLKRKEK